MCDSVGSPLFDPLIQDLSDDSDSLRLTTTVLENEITNVDVPEIISPLRGNAMGYLTTMVDLLQDSWDGFIHWLHRCCVSFSTR